MGEMQLLPTGCESPFSCLTGIGLTKPLLKIMIIMRAKLNFSGSLARVSLLKMMPVRKWHVTEAMYI